MMLNIGQFPFGGYCGWCCCPICNSQDMETTGMSISRGMDKEDVVHIYSGMLLSHNKEPNWVICGDMDGPRDCHAK